VLVQEVALQAVGVDGVDDGLQDADELLCRLY
jgi:hypothetical protein